MISVTVRFETQPEDDVFDVRVNVPEEMAEMPLDHPVIKKLISLGYGVMYFNYDE